MPNRAGAPSGPRKVTSKLMQKRAAEAARLYQDGMSVNRIAKQLAVDRTSIYHDLILVGCPRRKPIEIRHRKLDETVFDKPSEERSYWIGFLMADGCVCERGNARHIVVGLSSKDRDHLEKFRAFLGSDHAISDNGIRAAICIPSVKLASALASFGVIPKKARCATIIGLEHDRHFWRGVIDGDGCLGIYRNKPRLQLVGSKSLLSQFKDFAQAHIDTMASVRPVNSIFQFTLIHFKATAVASLLYSNCSVALDRKKDLADQFAAWFARRAA